MEGLFRFKCYFLSVNRILFEFAKTNLDFFDHLNGTAPSGAVPRFLFRRLGTQEKDARIATIALVELGNGQEFAPLPHPTPYPRSFSDVKLVPEK